MLDRIEPSSETCTMRSRPALIANIDTISSVTLPKVALSSPPSLEKARWWPELQPGTLRATEARAVARFVGVQRELLGDKREPLGEGCDRE